MYNYRGVDLLHHPPVGLLTLFLVFRLIEDPPHLKATGKQACD
jgi:hypothetical protein